MIIFPVCRKSRLEPDHDPPIATWLAITRPWFFRSGFESCDKAKAEGGGAAVAKMDPGSNCSTVILLKTNYLAAGRASLDSWIGPPRSCFLQRSMRGLFGKATMHLGCHGKGEGHCYSVPCRLAKKVEMRSAEKTWSVCIGSSVAPVTCVRANAAGTP